MLDFADLQKYRENNRIEAKKAMGGLPHSLWKTYSALANTVGGILLLGVVETADKSFRCVTLPDPEGLVREFWSIVNDKRRVTASNTGRSTAQRGTRCAGDVARSGQRQPL